MSDVKCLQVYRRNSRHQVYEEIMRGKVYIMSIIGLFMREGKANWLRFVLYWCFLLVVSLMQLLGKPEALVQTKDQQGGVWHWGTPPIGTGEWLKYILLYMLKNDAFLKNFCWFCFPLVLCLQSMSTMIFSWPSLHAARSLSPHQVWLFKIIFSETSCEFVSMMLSLCFIQICNIIISCNLTMQVTLIWLSFALDQPGNFKTFWMQFERVCVCVLQRRKCEIHCLLIVSHCLSAN